MKRVHARFALYAGLEAGELGDWKHLCADSARSLARRLRRGIDTRRHMDRLCAAAALCAWADYLALSTSGAADREVRVGDITLKGGTVAGLREAVQTRDRALAEAADLLLPECSAFLLAVREGTP